MAESNSRRAVYRLRAATNVAFPLAVAALGGLVLFIAYAMLSPLFRMIGGLA
jgi:type II secretory pathway component PulF